MLAYLLCLRRISGSLSEQVDLHNSYYQLCDGSWIVVEEVDIRHNLYQFPKSKPWSTQDWPFQLNLEHPNHDITCHHYQFPDNQSLVDTGLVTPVELGILEQEGALGRVWHTPISWAMTMIRR